MTTESDVRWGELTLLLSLHRVRAYLVDMGLPAALAAPAMQKDFLEAIRTAMCDHDDASVDLASATHHHLTHRCGPEIATAVMNWARTTYYFVHADLPQWSAWLIAFQVASTKRYNDLHLAADRRRAIYADFQSRLDMDDFDNKVASQPATQVDDWDVMVLAKYQWDPTDEDAGPTGRVRTIVEMHRFQCFGRHWASQLSEDEDASLQRSAGALLDDLGVWMPAPLAALSVLAAWEPPAFAPTGGRIPS